MNGSEKNNDYAGEPMQTPVEKTKKNLSAILDDYLNGIDKKSANESKQEIIRLALSDSGVDVDAYLKEIYNLEGYKNNRLMILEVRAGIMNERIARLKSYEKFSNSQKTS